MNEPAPEIIDEEISEEDQFIITRDKIAERLKDDLIFRQCIAEIYMSLSNMDSAVRSFAASGGMRNILKMMFGRGGGEDSSEE